MNLRDFQLPALVFASGLALVTYTFLGFQQGDSVDQISPDASLVEKAEGKVDFYAEFDKRMEAIRIRNEQAKVQIAKMKKESVDLRIELNQKKSVAGAVRTLKSNNPLLDEAQSAEVSQFPMILKKANQKFSSVLKCIKDNCSNIEASYKEMQKVLDVVGYISEIQSLNESQFDFASLSQVVKSKPGFAREAIHLVSTLDNPELIGEYFSINNMDQEDQVFLYKTALNHSSSRIQQLAESKANESLTQGDFGQAFLMVRNLESFKNLHQDPKAIKSVCRFKSNDDKGNMKFELLKTRLIAKYSAMNGNEDLSELCE